jgi:hypothetical protein
MADRYSRRRLTPLALAALAAFVTNAPPLGAQGSGPPQPAPQPPLAPYHAPVIALVQPPAGGSVPQDKPVVVFRFAQGEVTDPIDAASFRVFVDGEDRTALFQVSATEAWGPLTASANAAACTAATGAPSALSPGVHQLEARICSGRGTCATTAASVTVLPTAAAPPAAAPQADRKQKLIDLILTAAKKLLVP